MISIDSLVCGSLLSGVLVSRVNPPVCAFCSTSFLNSLESLILLCFASNILRLFEIFAKFFFQIFLQDCFHLVCGNCYPADMCFILGWVSQYFIPMHMNRQHCTFSANESREKQRDSRLKRDNEIISRMGWGKIVQNYLWVRVRAPLS